jgi:hypothetical protein
MKYYPRLMIIYLAGGAKGEREERRGDCDIHDWLATTNQ